MEAQILMLAVIIAIIVDLSGINKTIRQAIAYILNVKNYESIKFSLCSFCITWWTTLLYIIFNNQFTVYNLMLCAIAAVLTENIKDTILALKDVFTKILNVLWNF